MSEKGTFTSIIPIITLYAFAGYRLLPAIQVIYASLSQIRFNSPALDSLINDKKGLNKNKSTYSNETIKLKKQIKLNHIFYDYPDASRTALKDINIIIPAQAIVGLVGETGSGKTTLVDIILGLLQAQKGTVKIDDKIMDISNSREWQRSIGYVPQNIYLADDTVAANIAFGVKSEDINYEAVERAARISNLHNFVINELPKKYKTTIGERGVKLSGGQRQRIGIARALYYNPQILILDEATSALDNSTEKIVMDSINNLAEEITIILIAHRLETVKKCNIIFELSQGRITGQGSYESFINKDPNFNLVK
jgi:ABC-type bacteriocin/lantibiotic exporter with double-glycine peptidase domain